MAGQFLSAYLATILAFQCHVGYAARMKGRQRHKPDELAANGTTGSQSQGVNDILNDEVCPGVHDVLRKLVTLIKFDEKEGIGDVDEEEIMADLVSAISSTEVSATSNNWMDRLQDIQSLATMDPNLALEAGEIITISDFNTLNRCAASRKSQAPTDLEEVETTGDGSQIVEGDIVVPPASSLVEQFQDTGSVGNSSRVLFGVSLWRKNEVPWCFHPDTPSQIQRTWKVVLAEIEKQTCIRFKELPLSTNNKTIACSKLPSVMVQSHQEGCWSYVGDARMWGSQPLNLEHSNWGGSCNAFGIVAHEIGHALGLFHEHQRKDRDEAVTINWDNIEEDMKSNFVMTPRAYTQDKYDVFSLMHYGAYDFSMNPRKPTITAKNPEHQRKLGQRVGFSAQDIEQIKKMYKCKSSKPEVEVKPEPKGKPKDKVEPELPDRWCTAKRDVPEKKRPKKWCDKMEFCMQCKSVADPDLPSCDKVMDDPHIYFVGAAPDVEAQCRGPNTHNCLCHVKIEKTEVAVEPSWANLWNRLGSTSDAYTKTKLVCDKTSEKVYYDNRQDDSICRRGWFGW